jgi:hypothetical protein
MSVDGEKLVTGLYQQNGLIPYMAEQLSIRYFGASDAAG